MNPLAIQPIPYQGSKRTLAPRIAKLFPRDLRTLYEPFAGSAAVSVYAAYHKLAERFVIGDVCPEIIDIWKLVLNEPETISAKYRAVWSEQFIVGPTHFNDIRTQYNESRNAALLLYLIARCVKNAIRFNRRGDFTQSVDKRRTGVHPDKLEATIHTVSKLLRNRTILFCGDFRECVAEANARDLVYMDPPYQGTTYGPDKRYAEQLSRERLIESLICLNQRQVPFVLSYDGKTGEKEYAEMLPPSLQLTHLYIHAGRSSQSTLSGRNEVTLESLYISKSIASKVKTLPDFETVQAPQRELFA